MQVTFSDPPFQFFCTSPQTSLFSFLYLVLNFNQVENVIALAHVLLFWLSQKLCADYHHPLLKIYLKAVLVFESVYKCGLKGFSCPFSLHTGWVRPGECRFAECEKMPKYQRADWRWSVVWNKHNQLLPGCILRKAVVAKCSLNFCFRRVQTDSETQNVLSETFCSWLFAVAMVQIKCWSFIQGCVSLITLETS